MEGSLGYIITYHSEMFQKKKTKIASMLFRSNKISTENHKSKSILYSIYFLSYFCGTGV
jgi:hypothetical protein